jgi:hypothetical protein
MPRGTVGAMLLVGLALGCGERRAGVSVEPNVIDRARLSSELLFLDGTRNEVDAVDVLRDVPTAQVTRVAVKANPQFIVERSGGVRRSSVSSTVDASSAQSDPLQLPTHERCGVSPAEVLVLSDGSRDEGGDFIEFPTLTAISVDHVARHYPLSAPRGQMLLSADGRYALLWGQAKGDTGGSLLNDPNRVALVDLDLPPSSDNPFERTLKATGGTVNAALITHPLNLNGEYRSVALFSFSDGISVWDIVNKENDEITISGLAGSSQFQLKRLVEDVDNAQLYMIRGNEPVLRVLSFGAAAHASQNDFWPSWNQLSLGTSVPSDMMQYSDASVPKVLVATGRTLSVVDANNSTVATVALDAPATRIHGYRGASPNDNDVDKLRVLVWSEGGSAVSFVELTNLETAGSQNVELLSLGSYVLSDLVPLRGNLMLTVLRGGGVGTLDLDSRRFRPLASSVQLTSPLIESDARRIWVSGNTGSAEDQQIAFFEPETLATGTVRLDYAVSEVFEFENAVRRRIVATHDSPIGSLTIVDGTETNRSNARMLEGFLVDGLVNR